MKTTLDLPPDVLREIKLRAVLQGRPIKQLTANLLREALGMVKSDASQSPLGNERVVISEKKRPLIRCSPNAPATRATLIETLSIEKEALLEEDLQRARVSL